MESFTKSPSPPYSSKSARAPSRRSKEHPVKTSSPSSPPAVPAHLGTTDSSPPSSELKFRVSIGHNGAYSAHAPVQSNGSRDGCNESKGSKRTPGCEKFKSMQLLRERSDDRERVLDRERESSAKPFVGKRGRTDDPHSRPSSLERASRSGVKEEKGTDGMSSIGRKHANFDKKDGRDTDYRFAKGSSCLQAELSASHREDFQEAKNTSKSLAMRDSAAQMDVDRASPKEKKAANVSRLPLKKAYKTLRALNEVGNPREGLLRNAEHGSSSGGESTGARKRASPSKLCLDDGEHNGLPAEGGVSIQDFPIKFSHISKKARSHRERRSHDKVGNRGGSQEGSDGKIEDTSKQEELLFSKAEEETDVRVEGADGAGVSSQGADTKEEEGSLRSKGKLESREGQVGSDKILSFEGDSKDRHHARSEGVKSASDRDSNGFESIDHANNPVEMLAGIAMKERSCQEACAIKRQGDIDTVHSSKDGKKPDRVCVPKEEKMVQDAVREHDGKARAEGFSADDVVNTSTVLEMRKGLQRGPVGNDDHANQISSHKEVDNSKELTLSLFAKQTEAEGVKLKELTTMQGLEKEKSLDRAQYQAGSVAQNAKGNIGNRGDSHSTPGGGEKSFKSEHFQLSLALPGTSNAQTASHTSNPKAPVGPAGAFQMPTHSAHTQTYTQNFSQDQNFSQSKPVYSNSFTKSFSQSLHNPSCSLDRASLDNQELSCGGSKQRSENVTDFPRRSRQTMSANEPYGLASLSQDRSKHRPGMPLNQWNAQNGSIHGIPSASGCNRICESNVLAQRNRTLDQNSQVDSKNLQDSEANAWQGVKRMEFSGRLSHQEGAATHLSAARRTQSEPLVPHHPASPPPGASNAKFEDARGDRDAYGEKIGLLEIVTEPVASMAQKMQELPDSFLEGLKGLAKDLIGSFAKRDEFLTLQSIIKRRSDLTEHTLLHAQQTQLEILVAFKTGLQVFVQAGMKPLTYKVLTEIFLQTRCRNTDCQQSLPVDGCECKICTEKKGFCHDCMCVVCTKFDSDNQTCRWVGCDVCMHWCHTDCGLRMSYITSARSSQGAAGSTEMQYQCVACGHPSELFGPVKQAFQHFANKWGADTLTKELDCVRRIFHGSEDAREKQLCRKVEEMLQKLERGVETAEIQRSILQYFNDASANQGTSVGKHPLSTKASEPTNGRAMAAHQEAATQLDGSVGNRLAADKAHIMLQLYGQGLRADKIDETAELQAGMARKRAEIESMVRMKQAEANMLQLRADEAHQEARGLQKIIILKQEKIEGEYVCKYAKLKLNEAEEKRRRRVMELQELERAHRDYERMKHKIEVQIKDLAMKMEKANWHYDIK